MVFMPPRHGKSETISRLFSAYYLYCYPDRWVGVNSYADALASTLSRNARENYKQAGGEMSADAQSTHHWETTSGGGMWAAGVGGPITGKGFHLGIIDDPVKNAEEAQSETIREKHKDWYRSTFSTREEPVIYPKAKNFGVEPRNAAIVIVQTRWFGDDLSGWLLSDEMEGEEPERWHIISMEAIKSGVPYRAPNTCTIAEDDREIGEALCPERYPIEKLERIKKRVGNYYWSALYAQSPTPQGGGVFLSEWWSTESGRNRYRSDDNAIRNRVIARWLAFDTAFKDGESNDFSACAVFELWPDYRIALRWMWKERIQSAFLPAKIEELAIRWNYDGKLRTVVIEDKGSGTNAIQTIRSSSPAWLAENIIEFDPKGTKEYRAMMASVWCSRDCIMFPYPSNDNATWYNDFLDPERGQLFGFPNVSHDDMVDAFVEGVKYLENYISEGHHARNGSQ